MSASPPYIREFNPYASVRTWLTEQGESARRYINTVGGYDDAKLLDRNEWWFAQSFDDVMTARMLWLLNLELTRRGIGPAWRRIPLRGQLSEKRPVSSLGKAPVRELSDAVKRNLMRRWIDLEWLRLELGSNHKTEYRAWQNAFHENIDLAMARFAHINKLVSHDAQRVGPRRPYQVLKSLSVPKLHKTALTGLVDRDEGERRANVRRRVQERYRPILEGFIERERHPLDQGEVERRLIYCEAIELARGSPTDAATVIRWMTGTPVTRQTVAIMRDRIAEQCGLKGSAWRRAKKITKT